MVAIALHHGGEVALGQRVLWGGRIVGVTNTPETTELELLALPLDRADYRTLTFWANGGAVGGQRLTLSAVYNWEGAGSTFDLEPLAANTWTKIEVPLASLGLTDSSLITGLVISNNSSNTLPRYYIDEVRLTTAYPSWIVFVDGAQLSPNTLSVERGGFALNRRARVFVQNVTITNTGEEEVFGPVLLALDDLSSNTTLANADGTTLESAPIDSPYITVTDGVIAPGASVSVVLQFAMPRSGGITYSTRTLVGGENP